MKCPSCGYENSEGARYCGLCQKPFASFAREPSAPYGLTPALKPKKEAVQAAQKVLVGGATGENWFQRHLNWTWVFAQWAVGLVGFFITIIFVSGLFVGRTTFPSEESFFASLSVIQIIVLVLQLIAVFGVGAWVLKRKDRSLGWLLIFLVPFGAIVFLFLENRSELPALPAPHRSSIQPGLASPGLGAQYGKYGP
ncbi:MAG: hypothetical protein HQ588_04410 [Deltaproteobacteria bacterium]|nr:hypothetical protein [Deltaproteobacteria bacterium]